MEGLSSDTLVVSSSNPKAQSIEPGTIVPESSVQEDLKKVLSDLDEGWTSKILEEEILYLDGDARVTEECDRTTQQTTPWNNTTDNGGLPLPPSKLWERAIAQGVARSDPILLIVQELRRDMSKQRWTDQATQRRLTRSWKTQNHSIERSYFLGYQVWTALIPLSRHARNIPYKDPHFKHMMATRHRSFMRKTSGGVNAHTTMARFVQLLLTDQTTPSDTLLEKDEFWEICMRAEQNGDYKVLEEFHDLLVPSAETMAAGGNTQYNVLVEAYGEVWDMSQPLLQNPPQPYYSVGFSPDAFTEDQLHKLEHYMGEFDHSSMIKATCYMFFPFLTCEMNSTMNQLKVEDKQNTHSMTLAVRAVVELFTLANRRHWLHRQVVAFSISYNFKFVRLYGHYAAVRDGEPSYHRQVIHRYDITKESNRDKWTSHNVVKNIYSSWMPMHLERIRRIIGELPDIKSSEATTEGTSSEAQTSCVEENTSIDASSYEFLGL